MPERVSGPSKQTKVGQAPVAAPPRPEEEKLPELAPDGANVRNRPSSPEDVLARMVKRAKEAEEAAQKAAAAVAAEAAAKAAAEAAEAAAKAAADAADTSKGIASSIVDVVKGAVSTVKEVFGSDQEQKVDVSADPAASAADGPASEPASDSAADPKPNPAPVPAPEKIAPPVPQPVESGQSAQAAQAASQPVKVAAKAEPKGFWGGLWDGVTSTAGTVWTGIKNLAGKAWDGIKWASDKIGLTKGLKWLLPKLGEGFTWFQHKLQWALYGVSFDQFKSRKIEDDPGDVNSPDFAEVTKAKKEIPARAEAEKAALAKLGEDDRKKYEKLTDLTKGRPLSRWALQSMLLDGRIPGPKDLKGEGTLLDQLNKIATQDLAGGIKREDLLGDVVAEVENPVRINQQGKGTCVAATAQIMSGLASRAGVANCAGGEDLRRESDWADESDYGRSVSSRLIQPALMEMGMFVLDYDNTKDKHKLGPIPLAGGLMGGGSAHINEQLQGADYSSHMFFHWNRDSQWNNAKKALGEGKGPLPVGITWEDLGGHQLQIDKIENGKVFYTNPWGQRESMDEAEFKSHVTNVEIPTGR